MSHLIAIAGKGGAGKTTLAACLVRLLMENGQRPVLAVDADPNSALAPLLGLDMRPSISDVRRQVLAGKSEVTAAPKGRMLESELQEYILETNGLDLLTMGRPEGRSCYCEVNGLLREALTVLRPNYRATVVDNEAGMEHVSRMNADSIDCLALVAEATLPGARAVARIFDLAAELSVDVRRTALIWNKVGFEGVPPEARQFLEAREFDAVIELPSDEAVGRFATLEQNVLDAPPLPKVFQRLPGILGIAP